MHNPESKLTDLLYEMRDHIRDRERSIEGPPYNEHFATKEEADFAYEVVTANLRKARDLVNKAVHRTPRNTRDVA